MTEMGRSRSPRSMFAFLSSSVAACCSRQEARELGSFKKVDGKWRGLFLGTKNCLHGGSHGQEIQRNPDLILGGHTTSPELRGKIDPSTPPLEKSSEYPQQADLLSDKGGALLGMYRCGLPASLKLWLTCCRVLRVLPLPADAARGGSAYPS